MDTTQTAVSSEEPGNFLKNQLSLLVTPRNTGFMNELLKRCYLHFSRIFKFFLKVLFLGEYP